MKIIFFLLFAYSLFAQKLYFIPDGEDNYNVIYEDRYEYRGYMKDVESGYRDSTSKQKDIGVCYETEAGCDDVVIQKEQYDGVCINGCR
jgi:hypothetical protein